MKLEFSDRMFTLGGGRNKKLFDNLDTGSSYTNIWRGMTTNYLELSNKTRSAIFIVVLSVVRKIDWLINFLENHSNSVTNYIITFNSEPIFTTLLNQPK